MIFSSQLGKLDGRNTEQSIQSVANHLRKMQEELEYRLSVLDSSNITEINADDTKFLVKGEEISNIITEQDGKLSDFEQTIDGFQTQVADYEKGYSEWTQTVDGFTQQVGDYAGKVSEFTQTVDGFTQQVADYTTGYSSWEQTVSGFSQQVANYEGQYSTWEQTVEGFRQQVVDTQNALSTTLKMDETGLYIIDQDGNTVKISGDQIDADTIKVNNLYGETIYLNAPANNGAYYTAARIDITDSSSNPLGTAVEIASGAIRLKALTNGGDVHIESNSGYVSLVAAGHISMKSDVLPGGSDTYTLGSSSYKWKDVYSVNSEINTSDRTKKNSIEYDITGYEKLFDLLKPCSYKLNDGTSNRKHIGMISQDVEKALETAGLTTQDFAGFIKSPAQDEKGNVIEGEYDYALRYGEFIGLCISEIQKLKTRVDELERKATDNGQAG